MPSCAGTTVPRAAVALTDGTDVIEVVHGLTSLRSQVPVTPQTLFQIGSITKVYTATLVMALVDQTAETVEGSAVHMTARFIVLEGADRASWIHLGARATPRKA